MITSGAVTTFPMPIRMPSVEDRVPDVVIDKGDGSRDWVEVDDETSSSVERREESREEVREEVTEEIREESREKGDEVRCI